MSESNLGLSRWDKKDRSALIDASAAAGESIISVLDLFVVVKSHCISGPNYM